MKVDETSDSAFLLVTCTFLCCIAVPWSLVLIISLFCSGVKDDKGKYRRGFLISLALNIFLWVLIYYITQSIYQEDWMIGFDPYDTLDLTRDATMKQIKKRYRTLSQQYHPDKTRDDSSKKMFYLINKAKDILTNPEKKQNFMLYGHEDGKNASFKMSIALPTFLFDKNNQIIVLGGFAFFILVIFPSCVYKWFSGERQETDPETNVAVDNLKLYLKETSKKLKQESIIPMFASSLEFVNQCKISTESEATELNTLMNQIPKPIKEKYQRHMYLKNIVLIYSHIMNLQVGEKTLKKCFKVIRNTVPNQCEFLVTKMLDLMLMYYQGRYRSLIPMNNMHMILDFQRKYLNRVYTECGLELFTEQVEDETIEALKKKGESLKSLHKENQRKRALEKLNISDSEADIINQYYESLPQFKIGESKSYVEGHDGIQENDVATIDIQLHLKNYENQGVADNMLRESFNYPGQNNRVTKTPLMYVMLMEKGGKLINFQKIPFKTFAKDRKSCEVIETITMKFKVMFSTEGTKKLTVKIFNDSYIGIDTDLESEVKVQVTMKEVIEIPDDLVRDGESIDGSAASSNVAPESSDEAEQTDTKNSVSKKND
jgi:curved DNA-binding protein CbpA